jgi:SAM-dependent methyltransferase
MTNEYLQQSYDAFERIEEEFQGFLDESLQPRGPELLYDIVAGLGLPRGAAVLDLGCGRGEQSLELARRFGFAVTGVDPVSRQQALLDDVERDEPELRPLLRFEHGGAESLPIADDSVDLIWCREALYFFDLDDVLVECLRVLRPGGRMLIYSNFNGERMEPREAAWLWEQLGSRAANTDIEHVEAAFERAGFATEDVVALGSEFGEFSQETRGEPGRRLLHAARLLREPERYIDRFGQANYDIMLSDCFWHIYRLMGKLTSRIYVLRAP